MNPGDHASRKRIRYDEKTAALAGRHVQGARYWDVHHFDDAARAWDYDWHHAVLGVELQTDLGPCCVLRTSTFFPHGVEVFHSPMSEHIVTCDQRPEGLAAHCPAGPAIRAVIGPSSR